MITCTKVFMIHDLKPRGRASLRSLAGPVLTERLCAGASRRVPGCRPMGRGRRRQTALRVFPSRSTGESPNEGVDARYTIHLS